MVNVTKFLKDLTDFIKTVAEDERIPPRDKKVLLGLVALVVSPIDLIPDWIPIFGMLDDIAYVALILDYLFNILDEEILLSHYPWGMKSFTTIRRTARTIAFVTPGFIRNKLWKYEASPYSKKQS